jgi:glycerol kinase
MLLAIDQGTTGTTCLVKVPDIAETTALGAALLAEVGTDVMTLDSVRSGGDPKAVYEPRMSEDERATLMDGWHRAVERAREWDRG